MQLVSDVSGMADVAGIPDVRRIVYVPLGLSHVYRWADLRPADVQWRYSLYGTDDARPANLYGSDLPECLHVPRYRDMHRRPDLPRFGDM